ncbi:MerR family DNA-binding protein, partial [Desulfobacterota bacterium AH_259_B03_O07]|nr:MerR family DNA-binding protein [Desulfobacterota bacterium AH_259_B03_O07]
FIPKTQLKGLTSLRKPKACGLLCEKLKKSFTLRDRGFKPYSHVRDLLRQRIIDLEQKLAELTTLRREFNKLEDEWSRIQTAEDDKVE